nr:uncharacterized protein LOC121130443 [Lepeophtheirus salmonis]
MSSDQISEQEGSSSNPGSPKGVGLLSSDPRFSGLFELSSQLEALAENYVAEENAALISSDSFYFDLTPRDSHRMSTSSQTESSGTSLPLFLESSNNRTTSNCKTPSNEGEWKLRCLDLETSLQNFRDQAHMIRELLRDKVGRNL